MAPETPASPQKSYLSMDEDFLYSFNATDGAVLLLLTYLPHSASCSTSQYYLQLGHSYIQLDSGTRQDTVSRFLAEGLPTFPASPMRTCQQVGC